MKLWHELPADEIAEICSVQCGAKCCHRPFMYLADSEIPLFPGAQIHPRLEFETQVFEAGTGGFLVLDGPCPHLGPDNLCTIHESRPKACREFPYGPTPGCLLSPLASS